MNLGKMQRVINVTPLEIPAEMGEKQQYPSDEIDVPNGQDLADLEAALRPPADSTSST